MQKLNEVIGDAEKLLKDDEMCEEEEEPEEEEPFETERAAFTPRTRTIKRGHLGLESSYTFLRPREAKNRHSFPELLLRYGLTDRVELRAGWNQEVGGSELDTTGAFLGTCVQTLLYGAKFYLTRQYGFIPESSFITQGHTPTYGKTSLTELHLAYVFGWKLPNRWKLDSAVRYITDIEDRDHFVTWAPSVILRVPVGKRFQAHVEYFGLFTDQKEQNKNRQFLAQAFLSIRCPGWNWGFAAALA